MTQSPLTYYYLNKNDPVGPFTAPEMRQLICTGMISPESEVVDNNGQRATAHELEAAINPTFAPPPPPESKGLSLSMCEDRPRNERKSITPWPAWYWRFTGMDGWDWKSRAVWLAFLVVMALGRAGFFRQKEPPRLKPAIGGPRWSYPLKNQNTFKPQEPKAVPLSPNNWLESKKDSKPDSNSKTPDDSQRGK